MLDQFERWIFEIPMRGRNRIGGATDCGNCAGAVPVSFMADLFVALHRERSVPGFSMGRAAAGNGFARDFFRSLAMAAAASRAGTPALAIRAVAPALAAVQADVPLRLREIDER